MGTFYYLISSFPTLSLSLTSSPFTDESFLSTIENFVSKKDYLNIKGILKGESVESNVIKTFNNKFEDLKKAILIAREERKTKIKKSNDSNINLNALMYAKSLIDNNNPYDAEVKLLMYQWNIVDEMSLNHFGDSMSLYVYALKLYLLKRKVSFDKQKGKEEATRLMGLYNILEDFLDE